MKELEAPDNNEDESYDAELVPEDPHPRFTKIEKTGRALFGLFASPDAQDELMGPFKKLFFDEDE